MKRFACIGLLGFCAASFSATPSAELVAEYLRVVETEAQVNAQLEGYRAEMGKGVSPEVRRQLSEYLEDTMGWNAVKADYAELVRKTYTVQELKTIIAFNKSPAGASIKAKTLDFTHELAVQAAKRARVSEQRASETPNKDQDRSSSLVAKPSDLLVRNVERHAIDGRVYFTGTLENKSSQPARGVQVEVNLFQGERFVDQYSTYVSGVVPAGATRLFKVSCGCKDTPPAQHDSFKVLVVDNGY